MITYLIAQYLIVSGILKLNKKIAFSNLENAIYFFFKVIQLMGNLSLKLHINTSQLALQKNNQNTPKPAPSNMNIGPGQAPTRAQPNPKNTPPIR
jgi:hypothetical protein